uniref:Metallo-beta-lactamase domain-containing protein n=1 Tax=Globisporangium ultimum (strain ATCC 200006 / CBS 805.95 / DAOM BR144) TaxID=431595 RepID=K3WGI9_GLOUD
MASSMQVAAGGYAFHIRAVAGVESCCAIESVDVAFDMGCCFSRAARKSHVFITHGHVDHVGAFSTHAARRNLLGMAPANYYVPAHLVGSMQRIMENISAMQGDEIKANIVPIRAFEEIHISAQWMVKAVPTVHRVPSFGYIVYRKLSKLKDEYVGLPGKEIAALKRTGVDVTTTTTTPEIAYTGDTTAQIFESLTFRGGDVEEQPNDFLHVKVLITEATFVDDAKSATHATSRGHIHLDQLIELADRFEHVQSIILVHFSARYDPKLLGVILDRKVPAAFRSKLIIGHE